MQSVLWNPSLARVTRAERKGVISLSAGQVGQVGSTLRRESPAQTHPHRP